MIFEFYVFEIQFFKVFIKILKISQKLGKRILNVFVAELMVSGKSLQEKTSSKVLTPRRNKIGTARDRRYNGHKKVKYSVF